MSVLTDARPLAFTLASAGGTITMGTAPQDPVVVLPGATGLDDQAPEFQAVASAALDGESLVSRRLAPREVFVPLRLAARSLVALLDLRDQVRAATGTGRGVATLTVRTPRGDRSITGTARVEDTAMGTDTWYPRAGGGWGQRLGLVIRAHQPAWTGPRTAVSFPAPTLRPFFPLLPPRLSSSSALNKAVRLNLGGDLPTPGRWRIAGPWSLATLTDHTAGRVTTIRPPAALTSVEAVTVNTDPQAPLRIIGPDGTSAWPWLRPPYDLWPLVPGNTVSVVLEAAGPTSVTTLSVEPRWRAAL